MGYEGPPDVDNACWKCRFCVYDSNHDERWCDHKPPPEDIRERLIVDDNGTCEFFDSRWKDDDIIDIKVTTYGLGT